MNPSLLIFFNQPKLLTWAWNVGLSVFIALVWKFLGPPSAIGVLAFVLLMKESR